jgi:hypothetical protein
LNDTYENTAFKEMGRGGENSWSQNNSRKYCSPSEFLKGIRPASHISILLICSGVKK